MTKRRGKARPVPHVILHGDRPEDLYIAVPTAAALGRVVDLSLRDQQTGVTKDRARLTAAERRREREVRDQEIGDFAVRAARRSDALREDSKALASHVLKHWNPDWKTPRKKTPRKTPLLLETVQRILSKQNVPARIRDIG